MTNGEMYKTARERAHAFRAYCAGQLGCTTHKGRCCECRYAWLDLELREDEVLQPCPYCGGDCSVHGCMRVYVECEDKCGYRSRSVDRRMTGALIAEHNRFCRAVNRIADVHGDCVRCQDDPDWSCPWCGEPDGCNNRELGERIRKAARREDQQ